MQNIDAFQSILVGDDGSPEARRAVDIAFSLAKRYSAKLTLLCVKTPPSAEQQAEGSGLEEHERTQSQLLAEMNRSAEAGRRQGVDVAWRSLTEKRQRTRLNSMQRRTISICSWWDTAMSPEFAIGSRDLLQRSCCAA